MTLYKERLRNLRRKNGLTQHALASRAGVSAAHLWYVEHGKRGPSAALVVRIANALGLDPMEELVLSGVLENKKVSRSKLPSQSGSPETQNSKA